MRTLAFRSTLVALITVAALWQAEQAFYPSDEVYWRLEAEATCGMWLPVLDQLDVPSFPLAEADTHHTWTEGCANGLRVRDGEDYIEVLAVDANGDERLVASATSDYSDNGTAFWWFALGFSALLAAAVAWPVIRSSNAVVRVANRLSAGDLDARVNPSGPTEVRSVGLALNAMADRLTAQLRVRQVLLRAVAHELGQPLTRARFAAALLDTEDPERRAVQIARLERSLDRLEALSDGVVRLLASETHDVHAPEPVALAPLVAEVLVAHPGVSSALVPVAAPFDPELFRIAVRNLVENAVRHSEQHVRVTLDARGVVVEDDGPGSSADLDALVQPFQQGEGGGRLGLGLSIVHDIARMHGWQLTLDASDLGGARLSFSAPSTLE